MTDVTNLNNSETLPQGLLGKNKFIFKSFLFLFFYLQGLQKYGLAGERKNTQRMCGFLINLI